ncbi:GGDEF domain-containing protein [Aquincola tertiaricarbonis]|uniref:diguanylate cyclase n=1 Tax=Aquincola tertiaricarbonis TaxID=391953 RepID=A0ABY4S4A3_AQUTE|nr:diguanylate cyclase [Aquincola tertiaricarbonis]URI07269.1 GGDEF domain-containing protein [Aquincola tertiaricarbonis]
MITLSNDEDLRLAPEVAARLDRGHACIDAMDLPAALALAQEAMTLSPGAAEHCRAQFLAARCHYFQGEFDLGALLAREARDTAVVAGEVAVQALAQTLEARCLEQAGEIGAALDQLLLTHQLVEAAPGGHAEHRTAEQYVAVTLGVTHLSLGDLEAALSWCEQAVMLARPLRNQGLLAAAIDTMACVYSALAAQARSDQRPDQALDLERQAAAASAQAMDIARRAGNERYESSALLNLVESLTLTGDTARAFELLEDWQRRHPQASGHHRAHHLGSLGFLLRATGRLAESVTAFEQARDLATDEPHRVHLTEQLALALELCGRWEEALQRYKDFHQQQLQLSTERVRRSARVAAARPDIARERARARHLASTNAELQRRTDDLSRQALEDPLTGLPNRRHVDQWLHAPGHMAAVLMIDVDHFKQVNDRHSHALGDEVLRTLGRLLQQNLRPQDVVARLGGEEFVAIVPGDADDEAVRRTAERLRTAVEQHAWHGLAEGLAVTVSVGAASPHEATSQQALLDLADRRLYEAKAQGRNRAVTAG